MNHNYYSNYNSVINEGQRVRRMRRTQLSAQKVINHYNNHNQDFSSRQLSTRRAKSCRSLPKVQKSIYIYHKQGYAIPAKIDDIQNEYYKKGKQKRTQIIREQIQNKFYRHASMRQPKNSDLRSSSLPQKSYNKVIQEYSGDSSNSKVSQTSDQRILKVNQIKNRLQKSRFSKKSTHSKNSKLSSFRSSKKDSLINYDENYGIKNQQILKKKKKKQNLQKSQQFLNSNLMKSSKRSIVFKQRSQANQDMYQMRKQFRNQNNFILDEYSSKQKQKLDQKKIKKIKTQSKKSSYKQSLLSNSRQKFSKCSQFSKISNINFGQSSSDPIDQIINTSQFSSLANQNNDQIIQVVNGGKRLSKKKNNDSFNDAVGSLASVSILNQKKNSFIKKDNLKQTITNINKKISFKYQSNDYNFSLVDKMRNSFRNLPLTSRQPSQRKSIGQSRIKPMGNTLEQVMQRIQIHDFIITLLSDFGQQTLQFYNAEQQKYQRVCYLLQRKHFLQKNNMIKALRGGKNIFRMSSIQIPSQILNLYLQHPEVQNLIKQLEQTKKTLFKKLQKQYNIIRGNHKNDPFVKLQTPIDDFSKIIIVDLHKQLQQLYPCLDDDYLEEQLIQKYQDRIIEIIQFSGRKVKKLEFAEQIQDFYAYYEDNFANLISTIEFFQQIH